MKAIHLRSNWQNLGGLFALLICVGEIPGVWRSLDPLLVIWNQQEYSHAWFIIPLASLIFIQRFRAVRTGGYRTPGVIVAILSVVTMLFAWATGSYIACIYGAILGITGFVWSSLGTRAMRTLAAPLAYLFFMVPLPLAVYLAISADMQLLASKLGIILISFFQVPASLDGNIIIVGTTRLEVAEACNGLRYLFPLVSFACLISMLVEDELWKKVLIVFSSVPIAIVLNAFRIATIAVLLDRFNIDTVTGPAHAFEGFTIFFFCIVMLFLEVWFLLGVGSRRGRLLILDLLIFDRITVWRLMSWPVSTTSLVAGVILLVGTSVVANFPVRTEIVPQRLPLALFPMEFEGWRGIPQPLDSDSLNVLGLTDYVLANYTNPSGTDVPLNLYIAYYASQRSGIHAHSPQLCIPGGGWNIVGQSIVTLASTNSGPIPANRVIIEKQGVRQIVYYWFEERGRHIAEEGALKYYALRDALIDNRTDGALIRIVAPVSGGDEGAADAMAEKLMSDASSFLQSYVPGHS